MNVRHRFVLVASCVLLAGAATLLRAEDSPGAAAPRTAPNIYAIGITGTT